MMMHGAFMFFMSLGLGYVLCILAKKQEGLLKTLGYTLGISIIVLTLLLGLVAAHMKCLKGCMMMGKGGRIGALCGSMMKSCPMMKK